MLQIETSNEITNIRYAKLSAKLKNKISRQIQKENLDVDFQLSINDSKNIVDVVIVSKSLIRKIPQMLIIKIAEIVVKGTPEKFDVKIYSKSGEDPLDLVLSLNEETEKHYVFFDKIERVFTLKDKTLKRNRKRIATVNAIRRERMSRYLWDELQEKLGGDDPVKEEITRRKLYLEERIVDNDSLQKIIAFISALLFGGGFVGSLPASLESKRTDVLPNTANRIESSKSEIKKKIETRDNLLKFMTLVAVIYTFLEGTILMDTNTKKSQLSNML
jgi:hypothetical protein